MFLLLPVLNDFVFVANLVKKLPGWTDLDFRIYVYDSF